MGLWKCLLTVMSDACFMGTPKRVGPPFKAPLAWGASSRAMMDAGNDRHWMARAMVIRVLILLCNAISLGPCNKMGVWQW